MQVFTPARLNGNLTSTKAPKNNEVALIYRKVAKQDSPVFEPQHYPVVDSLPANIATLPEMQDAENSSN